MTAAELAGTIAVATGLQMPVLATLEIWACRKFRLCSAALSASSQGQPITYRYRGRRYIVVAAGRAAHIDEEMKGMPWPHSRCSIPGRRSFQAACNSL
jgi:hypothetical protein